MNGSSKSNAAKAPLFLVLIFAHRILIAAAVLFFIAWTIDQRVPFAGLRIIEYTSGIPNGAVTRPHPLDRVQTDERKRTERLIEDPVYFEVASPIAYERATITIRYENRALTPIKMGVKRSERDGDIALVDLNNEKRDGEWMIATAKFDLASVQRVNGRYNFLFSLPGVQNEFPERGYVLLSRMTIRLERKLLLSL